MKISKWLIATVTCCSLALSLGGCSCNGSNNKTEVTKMSYYDEASYREGAELSDINENLFYRNELVFGKTVQGADPAIMRITDTNDPDCGKFVLTVTAGDFSISCWLSSDLVNWEPQGAIICADKNADSDISRVLWKDVWAAELQYDAADGKYYMYFSASPKNVKSITGVEDDKIFYEEYRSMPYIAVADSWRGPFELIDHSSDYKYPDGTPMTESKAAADNLADNDFNITDNAMGYSYFLKYSLFDPYKMWNAIKSSEDSLVSEIADYEPTQLLRSIDFHPFVDDDGSKWLYFNVGKDTTYSTFKGTYCAVIKMNSWTEPDYSSFKTLTRYGYYELADVANSEAQSPTYENTDSRVNEGPWMTKHNGKYYLTFSINNYASSYYKVIQAVSDNPDGPFRKLTEEEGAVVLGANSVQDVGGPGHHSIVEVDGEMYMVYHKVDDYQNPTYQRHVAMNKVKWITVKDKSGNDLDVMYAEGPTTKALCALPEFASGYKNVAVQADVSATNLLDGNNAAVLKDGIVPIRAGINAPFYSKYIKEAKFKGETTITLTFADYVNVKAIMIYNSVDIRNAFYDVSRINFTYLDGDAEGIKRIDNLAFDFRGLTNGYHGEFSPTGNSIKTGAAAVAEFNEIAVKKIEIVLKPATQSQIEWHDDDMEAQLAIGEIVVLGK